MKANELRIGNYIQDYYNTKIFVVKTVDSTLEYLDLSDGKTHSNHITNLKPIPLTEDILLKCGFSVITENEDKTHNYWNKEKDCSIDVETFLLTNKIEKGFRYRVHERKRTKSIIYLHQLQNLYFALTGEELTINL